MGVGQVRGRAHPRASAARPAPSITSLQALGFRRRRAGRRLARRLRWDSPVDRSKETLVEGISHVLFRALLFLAALAALGAQITFR